MRTMMCWALIITTLRLPPVDVGTMTYEVVGFLFAAGVFLSFMQDIRSLWR